MHLTIRRLSLAAAFLVASAPAGAQSLDVASAMRWRHIGPIRGGRARAAVGVPAQPNLFYVGFDNGGVWRTTDYGSNWTPLFDEQTTTSIGAIAVAPSDPNVIYVGTGAGIIRPDLATGDGVYKSVDAGRSWVNLGLHDSQMIAYVDVDPRNPNRLFVAALGHPYGPNTERGIYRSLDGGKSFERVLYKDEYTSGADVRIDPNDPNTVYAVLWQQQQSFIEGQGFGGAGNGIFKSTDGGTTWKLLSGGLPSVIQANIAIAPSNTKVIYAMASSATPGNAVTGVVNLYRSNDGGESWFVARVGPNGDASAGVQDPRPLARIGGGDLPTIVVDPKNESVVYSASTVMWRTDDAGKTWTAVRGAPGGDDYQRIWVNPIDPGIILAASDQGAVISANHGMSWSNWYTQPTAAMYHVSTDNAFPYRVCGGQQDSGSACVASRSMDGRITFRDWEPVNIQEYGIAAPDPKDPNLVFGSQRTNVSLWNRLTKQTTLVGPDLSIRGPNGEEFGRNVRTQPIQWSPLDANTMFYASNVVWKTTDRGQSWTRISGDLARQTWAVPASAGKYASTVTPAPAGAITALSPSPRDKRIIWAGTDDGNIQTTADGGAHWSNVTPAQITPWTRIFNLEAGHFDAGTAYAAANTMRVDDRSAHFWRTHDGGKSWTQINTGITGAAVANSIREDPRVKGLLYAATDLQVWVSHDDGEHWRSLKLNMPAISVRDIQVKDDSSCMCSDLIAGTHGRGFWILDDLTPIRQEAAAQSAAGSRSAYLVAPATAVRVRFGTNDPTPWPPEVPSGENPMPGAIIDYALAEGGGAVKLEIVDAAGHVVRTYANTDPMPALDPATDPAGYNRLCQRTPNAPKCGLPLYWYAPLMPLSNTAGMHRFSWDMRFDPVEGTPASESATGAVPGRTYPAATTPWAPPGRYTVRLTAAGKTYAQPLDVKLDPRVKMAPAALARINALSREMYDDAVALRAAYREARAMAEPLNATGPGSLRARIDSIAPPAAARGQGGGGFGRPAADAPVTLESVRAAMMAAAMSMQAAEVAPTARQIAAVEKARAQYKAVMARWQAIRGAR